MRSLRNLCGVCGREAWRSLAVWLGLVALAVVIGVSERYAGQAVTDMPYPLALALRRSVEEWGLWGLLALGVVWLARRVPFEPGSIRRAVWIHLAASFVAAGIFAVGYSAVLHGQVSIDGTTFEFRKTLLKIMVYHSHFSLLIYWMIVITHHAILYYRAYQEGERDAAQLQAQLADARLDALRMQINPHFLFNTLHTISALIHEKPEVADRMVVRLSELLRLTLDRNGTQQVPLEQELAFLERYLEIERARFGSRLQVEFAIEPATRPALVPWLILQPLAENAVRHAIEPAEDGGRITISARRDDGRLCVSVADNGPGIEMEGGAPREGIGLANTRSRLEHLFDGAHEFSVGNRAEGGCEVRLALPFRTAPAAISHAG